ncbi:MAG: hypothetical protein ACTSUE_07015 [Promethearchaeota archaeon]
MEFIFDISRIEELDSLLCFLSHKMCDQWESTNLGIFIDVLTKINELTFKHPELEHRLKLIMLLCILGSPLPLDQTSNYYMIDEYLDEHHPHNMSKETIFKIKVFLNLLLEPAKDLFLGKIQPQEFLVIAKQKFIQS